MFSANKTPNEREANSCECRTSKGLVLNRRATGDEKDGRLRGFDARTAVPVSHTEERSRSQRSSLQPLRVTERIYARRWEGEKKLGRSSVRQAVAETCRPPDSQCLSVEVSKGALLFTYSQRPQKEVGPLGTGNPLPLPAPPPTTATSNTAFFFLPPPSIPSLILFSADKKRAKRGMKGQTAHSKGNQRPRKRSPALNEKPKCGQVHSDPN